MPGIQNKERRFLESHTHRIYWRQEGPRETESFSYWTVEYEVGATELGESFN